MFNTYTSESKDSKALVKVKQDTPIPKFRSMSGRFGKVPNEEQEQLLYSSTQIKYIVPINEIESEKKLLLVPKNSFQNGFDIRELDLNFLQSQLKNLVESQD